MRPLLPVLLALACATQPQPSRPVAHGPATVESVPATPPDAGREASLAPADESAPAPASSEGAAPEVPGALTQKRLDFRGGEPLVPVRLMERRQEVRFTPRGRMRLRFDGPEHKVLEAPAGSRWSVRLRGGTPARMSARVQLAEFPFADKAGLAIEQARWQARGLRVRPHVLGALFGIAGKVIDNRRYLLLVDEVLGPEEAAARQAAVLRQFGVRTSLFEEVQAPASGVLELLDDAGRVQGAWRDSLVVETLDGAGFDVAQVEYGVGYDFHSFEDRSYRGTLQLTVDRYGTLGVVNLVPLEDLLKGLVPSEIFARAHPEALKAQAVTARGEVLAKVGTKHLADPYLLCSEQHCAVYKGRSGEAASTSAAVEATRGEALFGADGRLVDSVYSAVCGGHTEDNDAVWGGPPNPNLRGRPDLLEQEGHGEPLPSPAQLAEFLRADLPAACRLSSFAQASKFRWERRFTAEQVDALTASLGIGAVQAMSVTERGVSGRAKLLTLSGEKGATQVRGELNIRRLFGMLNSAMFLVSAERDARGRVSGWVFTGGGWGHGVGMCQTGAIGRAEAGQDYREILRYYFSGAEVAAIY
ncbi:SpoIID/LytB domain-containing protein [Aggregicoccus sp. 17bor-14]|nr:SpoIID/LytB domain-containing protein [Simulacricoccus sp. 17bor-14]MRI86986.1 SpoIID/LytB domain-containing protein [Aggregicoccus sp. 17bor-14]